MFDAVMEVEKSFVGSVVQNRTWFTWLVPFVTNIMQYALYIFVHLCRYAFLFLRYINSFKSAQVSPRKFIKQFYEDYSSVSAGKIRKDGKQLSKLPKHLAVVLAEDEINCSCVVDIVVWSVLLGVTNVTVCDKHGYIQEHCTEFEQLYQKRCQSMSCDDKELKCNIHVGQFEEKNSAPHNIILSSLSHGRQCFVDCFKSLCALSLEKKIEVEKLDPALVNDRMKAVNGNLDDPDLLISFGDILSFHGYQPWAMRLTEIISFKSHQTTGYFTLLGAFRRYSGCQQRFGV